MYIEKNIDILPFYDDIVVYGRIIKKEIFKDMILKANESQVYLFNGFLDEQIFLNKEHEKCEQKIGKCCSFRLDKKNKNIKTTAFIQKSFEDSFNYKDNDYVYRPVGKYILGMENNVEKFELYGICMVTTKNDNFRKIKSLEDYQEELDNKK